MSDTSEATPTIDKAQRNKLADILEAHRGEQHLIVMHDFPDPDCISAAVAHQMISAEFDIETDIVYNGKISHQQNVAMVRLLGLSPTPFREDMNLSQYNGAVFVDNQGTSEHIVRALEAAGVPALIVVDHHEHQDRLTPKFSDIRPAVGSTASIYAEYLKDGLIRLDRSRKSHVMVTTALMHGIVTDTNDFIHAQDIDFEAAAYLSHYRDADVLGQIMRQSRSRQVMDIIRRALGNRVTAENFSIAGIGYVRAEDRDAIPQAADFLLTEENVHTVIVYGIVTPDDRPESLIGSLRTSKITMDPDGFIKDTLGKDEAGHYFGGGKSLAGGFEIPIGFLAGEPTESYRDLKWKVYDEQIKQKFFSKIGYMNNQSGEFRWLGLPRNG